MIKMNRVGVFLQVRLNSSRMPGKALLDLGGKPLIMQVMERVNVVPADVRVLLTSHESEKYLTEIAHSMGWEIFSGDSQNVLKRFVDAAGHFNVDTVIRVTGDNPFTSPEIAIETLNIFNKNNCDLAYIAPVPYGSGVEVVSSQALRKALVSTRLPYNLEHVTPYIHKNTSEFKVIAEKYHDPVVGRGDIRVTVDTREDYERANYYFKKLKELKHSASLSSLAVVWDDIKDGQYRDMLIITVAGAGHGVGHLKRMLRLAGDLRDSFKIKFSFLSGNSESVSMVNEYGFEYIDFESLDQYVADNGEFGRVITDLRDTTVSEMEIYSGYGPVYSIDDMGEGGQSAFVNVRTLPSIDKEEFLFNYDGLEYLMFDKSGLVKKEPVPKIKRILITFGGADEKNLTERVLESITGKGFEVKVVIGPFNNHSHKEYAGVEFVKSPETLKDLINWADLVFTSFGMTLMESLYCAVPVIIVNPSDYHDRLAAGMGYPYLIKQDEMGQLGNFLSEIMASDYYDKLKYFFELPFGGKYGDLIHSIKESQPAVAICPFCSSLKSKLVDRNSLYNMHRCPECSLYFLEYVSADKMDYDNNYFLSEYKNQYGKTYEEDRENIRSFAKNRLNMIKKYKKSGTLLDYGSGLGFFSEYASENGFDTLSCDVSDYACEYIRNKLGLKSVCADQKYFEDDESHFDVIVSYYVIEHIKDFEKLLFLFHCHLNPGGVLSLSTPNGTGFSIKYKFDEYSSKHPKDHYYIFNPKMFTKLLKRRGFDNIRIRVTGIHPGRIIKSKFLLNIKFVYKIVSFFIKILKLGDTFEIYAQKV